MAVRERLARNALTYVPLDLLLEMPRVRLLRLLARIDEWLGAIEISEMLDVGDETDRRALSQAISRGARDGLLEFREIGAGWSWIGSPRQYRISDRGRAELELLLGRANVLAPSEDMCVTCTSRIAHPGHHECGYCQADADRLSRRERREHRRRLAALDAMQESR